MDKSKGIYTMSVASEMVGMHPQTLRKYERHGLLKPARKNKLRMYSENDIKRLRQIKKLTDEGLNVAGLKRVLKIK